jgi:hypothetical protein
VEIKMTKLNVLNKKNEVAGVAVELENGRFEITEGTNVKEVAASTFKRWYKVVGEVVEVAAPAVELEALLADATEVTTEEEVAVEVAPVVAVEVGTAVQLETRGGKTEKVITKLAFNNVDFIITEYNGYVCDVVIANQVTGEVEYKSPKMSIKDALEYMGFTGEEMKAARKQISQMKKAAKLAI